MSTSQWPPQAEPGLERAYRRLLRAYPGDFRQRHGHEIVTTLLEMAEPGRRRPVAGDAWHLIGSGLRQRFRLPAGRPLAWVAAVLVTLIGGAFGAAAGSWAAERTFPQAPDVAAAAVLHRAVVGGPGIESSRTIMDPPRSPWSTDQIGWNTSLAGSWDVASARERLIADGWQVGAAPLRHQLPRISDGQGELLQRQVTNTEFEARRDGVRLRVTSWTIDADGPPGTESSVGTTTGTTGNAALVPAIVAGGVLGLAGGWLLAAGAARRIRHLPSGRSPVTTALATATVLLLALPAVAFYGNGVRAVELAGQREMVFTVHSALTPGPYWPFGPGWLNLALTGAGLLVGAGALTASRGRSPVAARQQSEELA
ncbi:hypothetical protein [Actinoplanes sp. DH11]|uniref:hypothetical protein n=1 Tax=Actinoplanes sp. DH11 TaxID=2857011 RepID=UPI001E34641E|nr:hypothetical protein [Actinoplanes sp. DH11]